MLCKNMNVNLIFDQFSSHKTSRWLRTGETKIKKSRSNDPYWYLLFLVTMYLAKNGMRLDIHTGLHSGTFLHTFCITEKTSFSTNRNFKALLT